MLLSRAGYYADFVVYPLLLLPLGAVPFMVPFSESAPMGALHAAMIWGAACAAGLAAYSLLEYTLHRHVLHRVQPFRRMHDMHHRQPAALVGTPTWLSATIILAFIFLPFWWQASLNVACGLTFGLIVSYLWYVLMHLAGTLQLRRHHRCLGPPVRHGARALIARPCVSPCGSAQIPATGALKVCIDPASIGEAGLKPHRSPKEIYQ